MNHKYEIGDTVSSKPYYKGIMNATIFKIDDKYYHCKILCGTATLPIKSVDGNYDKIK